MRSGEIVELLPLGESCTKIDIVGVGEELVEFLFTRSMRSLDLSVQLRRRGFDVGVTNAQVLNMPMELSLEFMVIVRSNLADSKRKFFDDGIDEVDRV